jgi:molecular chaperone DnaK
VYGAERFIKDSGDKLAAGDRQAIESAAESLKKAIESGDASAINKAMEDLTAAQHKAAASLYQQASTAGAGSAGTPGGDGATGGQSAGSASGKGDGKGDVIDAEVVDEGKN